MKLNLTVFKFLGIFSVFGAPLVGYTNLANAEEIVRVTMLPRTSCGLHFQNFSDHIQDCKSQCRSAIGDLFGVEPPVYRVILTPYSWQDMYQQLGGYTTSSSRSCTVVCVDTETQEETFRRRVSIECERK